MKKTFFSFLLAFSCLAAATAQIVNIPDANFKNVLVNTLCVDMDYNAVGDADADTNNDGEIQVSEAQAVLRLVVSSWGIQDMTGIQSFTNLQFLKCSQNQLTSLNVQGLTNLQILDCYQNQLLSLNVQGLTNLQTLRCYQNQLPSLNVQGLTNLQELVCTRNQLPNLNVQGLTNLQQLDCTLNQLPSLNVQGLTNLQSLACNQNQLTSLNVQGLTNLQSLACNQNQLPSLNVQGLTNVQYLECNQNQLTSLNVQGLTNLLYLTCYQNQLTSLNVQGLTNLQILGCAQNQLTSLNVQGLTNLQELICYQNQLTSLDVQGLTNLWYLSCEQNQLTSLNVQGLTNLRTLQCAQNPVSCLSFLPNSLTYLDASNTNITCLPNIPLGIASWNILPLCTPNNTNGCLFAARIYGKAYQDLNGNCMVDNADILQKNLLIQARDIGTQEIYTTNSKNDGTYELALPAPATYEVKALVANNNYWQSCPPQTVFLNADTVQVQRDFLMKPVVQCADVEIDHQLFGIARPCSTAVYRASYFNAGTITATGLTAKITLPTELTMQSATYPFTAAGGGVYHFALPNQTALARDTFSFTAAVSCTAQMGQMLCTEVEVLPNTYCTGGGLGTWDGSDVAVFGRCIGADSVRFVIQNIGTGNMLTARNYGVIEDMVMIRGNAFQLTAGASDSITIAADPHKIYRIVADEAPNNPAGNTQETFMVWGCSGTSGVHWGFVNNFGLNNGTSNPHQLCSMVRSSFDPNDISAVAEGVGTQHFILKESDLEYKIRFQNTGNDTAFVVRVTDKLPAELDAATLRIGSASHPFTWRLASNGVLEFLFQNIRLVDSTTNEPKSHGFVTYRIKTKPNLTTGTTINNQAHIYFDVNTPVATNIYTHTICESLNCIFLSTPKVVDNQYQVNIFPNPMSDATRIEVKNATAKKLQFSLYNALGQAVKVQDFNGLTLILQRGSLPQGCYFYTISSEGYAVAKGKLVIE